MAIYPNGTYRPLTVPNNDPPIIPVGVILHVAASTSKSLYGYFNSSGANGIESHFFIRYDGHTEQYRNTGQEADANLKANSFFLRGADGVERRHGYISVETQGLGSGQWTDAQIAEIKRLLTWISATHNVKLRKATQPFGGGVGYHVMFGAPGPWTPVAKSCPGPDRIRQFNNVIVPWMDAQEGAPGTPSGPIPEEELPLSVATDILAKLNAHDSEEDGRYARYEKLFAQVRADVAADRAAVLADNKVTRDLIAALAGAEAGRYADLAGRVQTGNDEERNRYGDYVARFNAVLAAVKEHDDEIVAPPVVEPPKA